MDRKRGINVTEKQKAALIEFVKKRPLLISGKQTSNYTAKDAAKEWQDISAILNSMPGAEKDWKSWRKAWQDLRSRTKTKQAKNQNYAKGTGGGKKIEDPLSKVEEDVLAIIKKVSVEGHEVPESIVTNFISNEQAPTQIFEEMESQATTEATHSTNIWSETCSEIVLPVENLPQVQPQKLPERKTHEKHKFPKKLDNLINSAVAATTFESNLKRKITLREEYYAEKLAILKQIAVCEERKAESLHRIAAALERNCAVPHYLDL